MHTHRTLIRLAVAAAVVLLAGMPALAADPDPLAYKSCTTPNGWTVQTNGPTACNSGDTCITYNVTGSGTPDHVGTFVRAEASPFNISGSETVVNPCGSDSVLNLSAQLVCHERLIHWNNQQSKVSAFSFEVAGNRKPIITSVVVRKGNSQGACPIVGVGLLDTTSNGTCVNSCGNFDRFQSIRKVETFRFKDCEVTFVFDTATGEVVPGGFTATQAIDPITLQPYNPNAHCVAKLPRPITEIILNGTNGTIDLGQEGARFGDGWINSGTGSCSTRLIGGYYYTMCY